MQFKAAIYYIYLYNKIDQKPVYAHSREIFSGDRLQWQNRNSNKSHFIWGILRKWKPLD